MVRAAIVLLFTLTAFAQTPSVSFSIGWDTNRSSVRVLGKVPSEWQKLEVEELQKIFRVAVEPANVLRSIGLPPMVGTYTVSSDALEFQPRYPFEAGVSYRAHFLPAKLTSVLSLPQPKLDRSTVVTQIYPTAGLLPQNLLKFYLHFSAPMSRGQIYEHIHLIDQEGAAVELPFLEIDEELWNPEMTRLTLFLDPGRIKRGVRPLEEVGPSLLPEKSYTLIINEGWHDGRGVSLKESFRKKFRVSMPDRESPEPSKWKITAPKNHTSDPVGITFTDPMDQALALRMISVKAVTGKKWLERNETRWLFAPDQSWKAGRYEIQVRSTIEDLAGNNIGKPFEVDLEEGNKPREAAKTILLFFEVE